MEALVAEKGVSWISIAYKVYVAILIIFAVCAVIAYIFESIESCVYPQTSEPVSTPTSEKKKELKPEPFILYDLGERMFIGVKRVKGLLTCQYTKNRKEAAKFIESTEQAYPLIIQHVSSNFFVYITTKGSILYPAYIEDTTIGWIKLPVNKHVGFSKSDLHMERVKYDLINSKPKTDEVEEVVEDDVKTAIQKLDNEYKIDKYSKQYEKAGRKLMQLGVSLKKDSVPTELDDDME